MELETKAPDSFLKDTPASFVVSEETKRLWAIQLDLLAKIDAICRKHNIRYSIDSGTLIGAKRHGGYIPWDDDVDVVMPRKDFEKFKAVVSSEISGYYFFQTAENSKGYYRPFARLLNTSTVAIRKSDLIGAKALWKYRQCVFVDILVADNIPDDNNQREKHFELLKKQHSRYWNARELVKLASNWRIIPKTPGNVYRTLLGFGLLVLGECGFNLLDRWYGFFCKTLRRYEGVPTKKCAPYTTRPYEIIDTVDFDKLEDVHFEYLNVKAFKNFNSVLSRQYGDWHKHVIGNKPDMYYDITEFAK